MKLFTAITTASMLCSGILFADQAMDDAAMVPGANLVIRSNIQKIESSVFQKEIQKYTENTKKDSDVFTVSSEQVKKEIIEKYPFFKKYENHKVLSLSFSTIFDTTTIGMIQQGITPTMVATVEFSALVDLKEISDFFNMIVEKESEAKDFKSSFANNKLTLFSKGETGEFEPCLLASTVNNGKLIVIASNEVALTEALDRIQKKTTNSATPLIDAVVKKASTKDFVFAIAVPQEFQSMLAMFGVTEKLCNSIFVETKMTDKLLGRIVAKFNTDEDAKKGAVAINNSLSPMIAEQKVELNSFPKDKVEKISAFLTKLKAVAKGNNIYFPVIIDLDLAKQMIDIATQVAETEKNKEIEESKEK